MSVCPSVRWSVGPLVTLLFFGLQGATNAVYTAPLLVSFSSSVSIEYVRHKFFSSSIADRGNSPVNRFPPFGISIKFIFEKILTSVRLASWSSGRARGSRSGDFQKFPVRIRLGILLLSEAEKIRYYLIFRFSRLT